jgi:cytochrome P450
METPHFKQGLVIAGIAYLFYYAFWQLTVGARRRLIIREKGCLPVKKYPTKDPILGIDLFRDLLRHISEHKLLDLVIARFERMNAKTLTFPSLGRQAIFTIEPENLKTIQALDFKKWSLGKQRKTSFIPFLGVGIFTTDGADWQHSRTMLRPNFHRSQIGDLETFEKHIRHLVDAIPRDGSTVDLQDLFFRLTIGLSS